MIRRIKIEKRPGPSMNFDDTLKVSVFNHHAIQPVTDLTQIVCAFLEVLLSSSEGFSIGTL
jgi:hypothetical protein